jgi:tartrate dehydrogenase/decarboxylase/D-malate dehydrogenase
MSASRTFRIAAIPADGVGKEVIAAGREVLDALAASSAGAFAFDWQEFGWGCEYYARTGQMMAEDGLEVLKGFDAIYFGAVGWPGVPDHISLWGLRLAICQNFDQWANVRPVRFLPGVRSPLRKADDAELDWVVVRGGRAQLRRTRRGRRGRRPVGPVHRGRLRTHHALRLRPGAHPRPAQGLQRH